MIRFEDFRYGWSYNAAISVRNEIYGEESLVMVGEFWKQVDDEFVSRALAPQKTTYLHEFIAFSLKMGIEYSLRKWDYSESILDLRNVLGDYGVPYVSYDEFPSHSTDEKNYDYSHYLSDLVEEHAISKVAEETFTLLFPDRELLLAMNRVIAKTVQSLKKKDYPKLLDRDGVVKRCQYWPTWLRNGVFYRDTGHCSLCGTDLSGLVAPGVEPAIDHIVPLSLGGTNDPTNLQLLCKTCNAKKAGSKVETSARRHMYW